MSGKAQVKKGMEGKGDLSYCQLSDIITFKSFSNLIWGFGRTGRGKCDRVFLEFRYFSFNERDHYPEGLLGWTVLGVRRTQCVSRHHTGMRVFSHCLPEVLSAGFGWGRTSCLLIKWPSITFSLCFISWVAMNCTGDEMQNVEGENASGKNSVWDPNCLRKT